MPSDLRNEDIYRIVMFGSDSKDEADFIRDVVPKTQFKIEYSVRPYNFIRKTFLKIQFNNFLEKTLFIGDGEKLIEHSKLAQLSEKTVADYAPVIINAHGNRIFKYHTIDLIDSVLTGKDQDITVTAASPMLEILRARIIKQIVTDIMLKYTDNCFKLLSKFVDKTLFVQLYACYGTTALQYVNSLPEKSILFTYGEAQSTQINRALQRCQFGFWKNYENGITDDRHPIIQIAHNFYDSKSLNFGFSTNIGVAISTRNSCLPNKVELKHEINHVMADPRAVAKDNLDTLKELVNNNSKYVDNIDNVLHALNNLQKSLEEQDIDCWGRFVFNTSMVDICTNISAAKVIKAWKQNETSPYVTSFVKNHSTKLSNYVIIQILSVLDKYWMVDICTNHGAAKVIKAWKQNETSPYVTSSVKNYLTKLSNYVIMQVLSVLDKYWNDKLYSEYEDSVNFLLDEEIDINASKRYNISRDISEDSNPIVLQLISGLSNRKLTDERKRIIEKTLNKICSDENFDVNSKDEYGNPIALYLIVELSNSTLTAKQQQMIGKVLDKICSHKDFDINTKGNDGEHINWLGLTVQSLRSELAPELKQILEQISDKLRESSSDVNSVKDNDMCESYEHQDLSDSYLQDEVDSDPIGLSGDNTSSCQYEDLICDR